MLASALSPSTKTEHGAFSKNSHMLALLRFLVKCALIALVVAFFSSIGMAYLWAHPELKSLSQIIR